MIGAIPKNLTPEQFCYLTSSLSSNSHAFVMSSDYIIILYQ
nr:MAG TPA: hypothetical protein [Caudoviricetes sp.]